MNHRNYYLLVWLEVLPIRCPPTLSSLMFPQPIWGSASGSLRDHSRATVEWKHAAVSIPIDAHLCWSLDWSAADPPIKYMARKKKRKKDMGTVLRMSRVDGRPSMCLVGCRQHRLKYMLLWSDCHVTPHSSLILGTPCMTPFCHSKVQMRASAAAAYTDFWSLQPVVLQVFLHTFLF